MEEYFVRKDVLKDEVIAIGSMMTVNSGQSKQVATLAQFRHKVTKQRVFCIVISETNFCCIISTKIDIMPKIYTPNNGSGGLEGLELTVSRTDGKYLRITFANKQRFVNWQNCLCEALAEVLCCEAILPLPSGRLSALRMNRCVSVCRELTRGMSVLQQVKHLRAVRHKINKVMKEIKDKEAKLSTQDVCKVRTGCNFLKLVFPTLSADPDLLFLTSKLRCGPQRIEDLEEICRLLLNVEQEDKTEFLRMVKRSTYEEPQNNNHDHTNVPPAKVKSVAVGSPSALTLPKRHSPKSIIKLSKGGPTFLSSSSSSPLIKSSEKKAVKWAANVKTEEGGNRLVLTFAKRRRNKTENSLPGSKCASASGGRGDSSVVGSDEVGLEELQKENNPPVVTSNRYNHALSALPTNSCAPHSSPNYKSIPLIPQATPILEHSATTKTLSVTATKAEVEIGDAGRDGGRRKSRISPAPTARGARISRCLDFESAVTVVHSDTSKQSNWSYMVSNRKILLVVAIVVVLLLLCSFSFSYFCVKLGSLVSLNYSVMLFTPGAGYSTHTFSLSRASSDTGTGRDSVSSSGLPVPLQPQKYFQGDLLLLKPTEISHSATAVIPSTPQPPSASASAPLPSTLQYPVHQPSKQDPLDNKKFYPSQKNPYPLTPTRPASKTFTSNALRKTVGLLFAPIQWIKAAFRSARGVFGRFFKVFTN